MACSGCSLGLPIIACWYIKFTYTSLGGVKKQIELSTL